MASTPLEAHSTSIGALLLDRKLITRQDLAKALAFQRQFKGRLGSVLVRMGALSEDSLLPVLADALEEAGCTNEDILTHCRGPGPHVLGCWVVDLLLNRT